MLAEHYTDWDHQNRQPLKNYLEARCLPERYTGWVSPKTNDLLKNYLEARCLPERYTDWGSPKTNDLLKNYLEARCLPERYTGWVSPKTNDLLKKLFFTLDRRYDASTFEHTCSKVRVEDLFFLPYPSSTLVINGHRTVDFI